MAHWRCPDTHDGQDSVSNPEQSSLDRKQTFSTLSKVYQVHSEVIWHLTRQVMGSGAKDTSTSGLVQRPKEKQWEYRNSAEKSFEEFSHTLCVTVQVLAARTSWYAFCAGVGREGNTVCKQGAIVLCGVLSEIIASLCLPAGIQTGQFRSWVDLVNDQRPER